MLRSTLSRAVLGATALTVTAVLAPLAPAHAASDTLEDQLHRLRTCEASGNYTTNTGNGYYGAYQFDLKTWHRLGYASRPDRSAKVSQDNAAKKLHAQSGWRPWPSCARSQHLH